jgi:hypothetical protein
MLPDWTMSDSSAGAVVTTSELPACCTPVTTAASKPSSNITLPFASSPSFPELLEKVYVDPSAETERRLLLT